VEFTHVYEVVGEVLFRRTGRRSVVLQCKVVRTRVLFAKKINGLWSVKISEIISGYGAYVFDDWFEDWTCS